MDTLKYYDKKYFDWQKSVGEFGGKANLFKFEEYISETSDILDFGAGGYLLSNISKQGRKIGVEINVSSRTEAETMGIE